MVTKSGAKLLDFGLAKASRRSSRVRRSASSIRPRRRPSSAKWARSPARCSTWHPSSSMDGAPMRAATSSRPAWSSARWPPPPGRLPAAAPWRSPPRTSTISRRRSAPSSRTVRVDSIGRFAHASRKIRAIAGRRRTMSACSWQPRRRAIARGSSGRSREDERDSADAVDRGPSPRCCWRPGRGCGNVPPRHGQSRRSGLRSRRRRGAPTSSP